jgi:hypothetical protein
MKILAHRTPAHFRWEMDHKVHKKAFDIGEAVHSLVLEDDQAHIRKLEYGDYRTKEAQAAKRQAYDDGVVPLLPEEWAQVHAMRDAVMADPRAQVALTATGGGAVHVERSFFWQHPTGVSMRARMDAHNPFSKAGPIVADVKTVNSADPEEFRKTAWNLGYHQQDANYRAACDALTSEVHQFVFILVEKEPPHLVSVIQLDDAFVDAGRMLNEKAVRIFAECSLLDEWPGWPATEPIAAPNWAQYALEDLLK